MFYLTKDMAVALEVARPYTNLKEYLVYKQRGSQDSGKIEEAAKLDSAPTNEDNQAPAEDS